MAQAQDVLKHSVTKNDQGDAKWGPAGAIYQFFLSSPVGANVGLPPYWSPARDATLRASIYLEDMWHNAVGIFLSKLSTLSWELKGGTNNVARFQELLLSDWLAFVNRIGMDFATTDNGSFAEVVYSGARVIGVVHLDSQRCTRTGDADYPLLYRDKLGYLHELKDWQVFNLSDEPDPAEMWYGVGHCAASRSWNSILSLSAVEQYKYEKVSGRRALSVYIVNGASETQIQQTIESAREQQAARGLNFYMGAVVLGTVDPTATPSLVEIPLASLPDGFEAESERRACQLKYAKALGLDPQAINPDLLSSRAMGTGAQSRVIEEQEQGMLPAVFRKQLSHLINEYVLPASVTHYFVENDYRDQLQQAQITQARAQARQTQVTTGEITKEEARQMAVDANDVPREFIQNDLTPNQPLSDEEKPVGAENEPVAQNQALGPEGAGGGVSTVSAPALAAQIARALATVTRKEVSLKGEPPSLASLLTAAEKEIAAATDALQAKTLTLDAWNAQVEQTLSDFHARAYQKGARVQDLSAAEQHLVDLQVADQRAYLDRFAQEIGGAQEWDPAWNARAGMYAQSIGASYWNGRTKELPLPSVPKDGTTQCLTNCQCRWEIKELDGEAGDYDATWQLGAADHCQTCTERAAQWNPLRIRGGKLQ